MIGSVTSVRVRPSVRENPVEIVMGLRTPYELSIPKDSTVSLETAGVLGETFPEIDSSSASGPPLANGGILKSRETPHLTPEQLLERFADVIKQKPDPTQAPSEDAKGGGSKTVSDSHRR